MKKIFALLAFLFLFIAVFYLLFGKADKPVQLNRIVQITPTAVQQIIPTPTPKSKDNDLLNIKSLFVTKYGWNINDIKITIKSNSGEYASGLVQNGPELGGGAWFAAKKEGIWVLVWDGNGIIGCTDLKDFSDFPTTLIPNCYDYLEQKLVDR